MSHASHICVCNAGHALDDDQVLIDFENTGDQRHRDNFIIFPTRTFDVLMMLVVTIPQTQDQPGQLAVLARYVF